MSKMPVSIYFHGAHRNCDWFERAAMWPFSRFRHCTMAFDGIVFDFNLTRPAWYKVSQVIKHYPPASIIRMGLVQVYDVVFKPYRRFTNNCIHFIADALGLTLPRPVLSPDTFWRWLVRGGRYESLSGARARIWGTI